MYIGRRCHLAETVVLSVFCGLFMQAGGQLLSTRQHPEQQPPPTHRADQDRPVIGWLWQWPVCVAARWTVALWLKGLFGRSIILQLRTLSPLSRPAAGNIPHQYPACPQQSVLSQEETDSSVAGSSLS